jgi:hypothetical protein
MEMSPNVSTEIQCDTGKNMKKPSLASNSSSKNEAREIIDLTSSSSDSIFSTPAARNKNKSIYSLSVNSGLANHSERPKSNHMSQSPTVLRKSLGKDISVVLAPSPIVEPARERPRFVLPAQTPMSSKASNHLNRSMGRSSVSPTDEHPNSYMRLIRQQFEFVELSHEDVTLCKDKNVPVELGQVALRCRHCTCLPVALRPKGSLVISKLHRYMYEHFFKSINVHTHEICPFVPTTTKQMLNNLRLRLTSSGGQRSFWQDYDYWCSLAKTDGVVQTQKGLRFKDSLKRKIHLYPTRGKTSALSVGTTTNVSLPRAVDPIHERQRRPQQPPKETGHHPIDQVLDKSDNFSALNLESTMGDLPTVKDIIQQCMERNHREGVLQTDHQKAVLRTWCQGLKDFIDYKDRFGHGKSYGFVTTFLKILDF